jgi:hypothetical protein
LGATAVAAVGVYLGGVWFPVAVAGGCVLAALLVRRNGFFTVMAQPPLVTAAVVAGAVLLGKPLLSAVAEVSATFPYLIATMVVVGLIVLSRVLTARRRRGRVA